MAPDQERSTASALTEEDLHQHEVIDLPNREALSLIEPGLGLIEGNIVQPQGTTWDPTEMNSDDATGGDQTGTLGLPADGGPDTLA